MRLGSGPSGDGLHLRGRRPPAALDGTPSRGCRACVASLRGLTARSTCSGSRKLLFCAVRYALRIQGNGTPAYPGARIAQGGRWYTGTTARRTLGGDSALSIHHGRVLSP